MSALFKYRQLAGLTQAQLGKKLGVTSAAICHYERGARTPPPAKQEFISKITRGKVPAYSWRGNKMQLSEHFTLDELCKSATADKNEINNYPSEDWEIDALEELAENVLEPSRELLGVPLLITSGFRCYTLNRLLGSKDSSQHPLAQAADFIPKGVNVFDAAIHLSTSTVNFDQLIFERNSRGTEWIHISNRDNPRNEVLTKLHGQPYRIGLHND